MKPISHTLTALLFSCASFGALACTTLGSYDDAWIRTPAPGPAPTVPAPAPPGRAPA